MEIGNKVYLHKKIRLLCLQLEIFSGLKLITNLDDYLVELRFMNKYGYIIIDWRKHTIFTLSHKMDKKEFEIAQELMIYLSWLETEENIKYMKGGSNFEKR